MLSAMLPIFFYSALAALLASHPFWPTNGWREATPESQGLESGALADAFDFIREKRIAVHSFPIVRHGFVVLDASFYPDEPGAVHDLASVTKSVTSYTHPRPVEPCRSAECGGARILPERDAMFDDLLVNGDLLYPDTDDFTSVRFKIRIPWYRSLTASCVEGVEVSIDGTPISRGNTWLTLHGLKHSLDEVARLDEVLWYVLDTVDVHVRLPERLVLGTHEVAVVMRLRIPYSRDSYAQYAQCKKSLTLVARDW